MRRRVVLREAVMVGGLGRRCLKWADVKWLRVFGKVQCSAVRGAWYVFECVCGNGAKDVFFA